MDLPQPSQIIPEVQPYFHTLVHVPRLVQGIGSDKPGIRGPNSKPPNVYNSYRVFETGDASLAHADPSIQIYTISHIVT